MTFESEHFNVRAPRTRRCKIRQFLGIGHRQHSARFRKLQKVLFPPQVYTCAAESYDFWELEL